jgi:superfamily II DNA or RNA helicase
MKLLDKAGVRSAVSNAQLFIFDECQYAASETLQFLHKASTAARHRFLLSGTPWRDSGDDILIEAVSGRRFCDISATYLIDKGYLVAPDIHFVNVPVMRNVGKKYHDVYKNYVVENDDRNELIVKAARKLVAAKKRVLILVVRVQHGKLLQDLLQEEFSVKFLDGGKGSEERLGTINEMKSGNIDILIASKIFDQGVDIPELDALILAGSGKSSGRALQRIGRVIRLCENKSKAIVVEFFDNCKYLRDHSEARIKVYESEPGFNIKMPKNKVLHSYPKRKPVKWS